MPGFLAAMLVVFLASVGVVSVALFIHFMMRNLARQSARDWAVIESIMADPEQVANIKRAMGSDLSDEEKLEILGRERENHVL